MTGALLADALWGWPLGFAPPIGLTVVQTLHYLVWGGSAQAFPVQVRIDYLVWMLAGLWESLGFFHWIQLAGTTATLLVDCCPMARLMSLMPRNRRAPLTLGLIVRTFARPPVRSSILDASV